MVAVNNGTHYDHKIVAAYHVTQEETNSHMFYL